MSKQNIYDKEFIRMGVAKVTGIDISTKSMILL